AAYLAGLAVGYWKDKEEVRNNCQIDRKYQPAMTKETREKLLALWHKGVNCALNWAEQEEEK
ncbi:MAG: glycerol kinase, partial [Anaerovoracaceae bacterium]